MSYDDLLPPGSDIRKIAYGYLKDDFEMFSKITTPPFDNTRYKEHVVTEEAMYLSNFEQEKI